MRFRIRHVSTYRYERPVRLGPHRFRLEPHGPGVRLEDFRLALHPSPASLERVRDDAGNPVRAATFDGDVAEFRVATLAEGETVPPALPDSAPDTLPPYYGDDIRTLWAYRIPDSREGMVADFARAVAADSGGDALVFLRALSAALHQRVRNIPRLTGAPLAPEVTLGEAQGSCRDFAVLFIACCRLQGLAARFVSGYLPAPAGEIQHMHAWAEAHVPGIGWTPWDPTLGGLAGETHIPVAAAAEPPDAAPITGTYEGSAASELSVELKVEVG